MKRTFKTALLAVSLAAVACLAACGREKIKYVEPPTETVTFASGETAVYELVTDESGEAVTDEEGETRYKPYVPPVTDKDGYLVTDKDGSTKKNGASDDNAAVLDMDAIDLDEPEATAATGKGGNEAGEKTTKGETTEKDGTTKSGTTLPTPGKVTEKQTESGKTAPTKPVMINSGSKITGELEQGKAQKLYRILKFNNEFDPALVERDYEKANAILPVFLSDIQIASNSIRSDKALYSFVTKENLDLWLENTEKFEDKFKIFMTIYRSDKEAGGEYSSGFYTAYEDFQRYYSAVLRGWQEMQIAAEKYM